MVHDDAISNKLTGESGNRRALVLAAYARIAATGFEGLRTRDVAADVGINIGTLHYYFPSKEALIRAVVHHCIGKFAATMSSKGTAAEQLQTHLEGIRHLLKTDQLQWAVLSEVSLRAARDETIAALMSESQDHWFEYLRGLVSRGVDSGVLDAGLDPDGVAATLIAAIGGVCMPTLRVMQPQRIDQTFDQLERWLGMSAASHEPVDDGASL